MPSPRFQKHLLKIVPFGIIWGFFGLLYVQIEYGLLGDTDIYPTTRNPYQTNTSLYFTTIGSFVMGILIGCIEVLGLNRACSNKPFIQRVLIKTSLYLSSISVLILIIVLLATSERMGLPLHDSTVLHAMKKYAESFAFPSLIIYAGSIAVLSLFILEVTDYLGSAVLKNFVTGRYMQPVEEDRIFMFLDLKSSTTIAEELGNLKFFEFLNRFYSDISDAILQTSGIVYQYVGDEIIVSWNLKDGTNNCNCIHCFFLIKEKIQSLSDSYFQQFSVVPKFKAGLHCGRVTAGEIGVLKKEILFCGDVLNTTARIQSHCSRMITDILISSDLMAQLTLGKGYRQSEIGEYHLKGKREKIRLFTLAKHQKEKVRAQTSEFYSTMGTLYATTK